jgi:large subunit ribosomal protein L29
MKSREIKQLHEMTGPELDRKLLDLKKELFNLRMQHATNQLDNPIRLRETRHDIARVKTVLAEKSLKEAASK